MLNEKVKILENLLIENINKEIKLNKIKETNQKVGLLFSGGIDSVLVALLLKKLNINFDAYFGYVELETKEPKDLVFARNIAKSLNINLIENKINLEEIKKENLISKLIDTIETINPIHVGVSIPIYLASKKASKNNCNILFCGSGSDELFCGYSKFKEILEDNILIKELSKRLVRKLPNVDLKRDNNITNLFNIKLITPYFQENIINFAINLDKEYKINNIDNKIIIRELANTLELNKKYSSRKKVAAQYGSNSNKVLEIISKENGFKKTKDYFKKIKPTTLNLSCLYSSGKDSNLALFLMKNKGYNINSLLSIFPETDFSYMYQKPDKQILELQAQALGLPLLTITTKGEKEKELTELEQLLKDTKELYNIDGIITGALFSQYQKERIENICEKLDLECFSPLWHMNQEEEIKLLLQNNFKFIFTKVAALGLDKNWLGKIITNKELEELKKLNKKIGLNIAGEGGEFESVVIDCPLFNKKLNITNSNIIEIDQYTSILDINEIELIKK